MRVQIIANKIQGKPIADGTYTIGKDGTASQNNFFHALVQEWYVSGCHSYNTSDFRELRGLIKRDFGVGFEKFVYINNEYKLVATFDKPFLGDVLHESKKNIFGILKSWAKYSRKERSETIDRLINAMLQSGVNTNKFSEIIEGVRSVER